MNAQVENQTAARPDLYGADEDAPMTNNDVQQEDDDINDNLDALKEDFIMARDEAYDEGDEGNESDKELEPEEKQKLEAEILFWINGVSGIKRGDKFTVDSVPSQYRDGFFQVLSVKHSVEGMHWYTEVTGGYRNRIK